MYVWKKKVSKYINIIKHNKKNSSAAEPDIILYAYFKFGAIRP